LPAVAVANTWRLPGAEGSGEENYAFLSCDFCEPGRAMPGSVQSLVRVGWRFGDLERGPHRCPLCPPGRADGPRLRRSPPSANPASPDLIVVGAAKAATTALHQYLDRHPEIAMAADKELNFFCRPDCLERMDEYRLFFDGRARMRGESSPWYAVDPVVPGVPERIRACLPDVKLIYLVRDPVDRALGDYAQYTAVWEPIAIEEAFRNLGDPFDRYTAPGLYAHQLERYLEVFPPEQILVIDQADLLAAPRQTLAEAFRFLGVDDSFESPRFSVPVNTSAARRRASALWRRLRGTRVVGLVKRLPPGPRELVLRPARRLMSHRPEPPPQPSAELRERLRATFADDAARLRQRTGREFASWRV
jgi:Sulfotransferase domain